MKFPFDSKVTRMDVIEVFPSEHSEKQKEIKDPKLVGQMIAEFECDDDISPLFEDILSPRFFVTFKNGKVIGEAQILRSFIDFGEGWQFIKSKQFLQKIDDELADVKPKPIIKPEEGRFEFSPS